MTDIESDMDENVNNTTMNNNNDVVHDDHDDNIRVNDDVLNNSDDENECPTIVNGMLTFVMSIMRNSTNPKMVEIMGRYFDHQQVKDAKSLLCDISKTPYRKRQDIENRIEKMAHIGDIVDILRELDRANRVPFFVVDSIGLAALPKLNAEDVNYVTVAEKMVDMFNKMEVMNDAIAANTVRSIDSEKHLQLLQNKQKHYPGNEVDIQYDMDYPEAGMHHGSRRENNGQNFLMQGRISGAMPTNARMPTKSRMLSNVRMPTNARMPYHNAVKMTGSQPRSACRIPPLIADPIIVPVHKSQPMPAVTSAVRNESTGPRDHEGPTSEPGGVNDAVTVTSTSAVSTATVLEVPLNSSITTTAGCATQATLVQSNGANPVGPRDAVSVDQKDGHLDVQVSTDSNRGNQLPVCDDHNGGHPRDDPPAGYRDDRGDGRGDEHRGGRRDHNNPHRRNIHDSDFRYNHRDEYDMGYRSNSYDPLSRSGVKHSASRASIYSEVDDSQWEVSKSHFRSFDRRNQEPISGTASADNVKGTIRNASEMFVSRVQQSTSDDAMIDWIEHTGVTILDFERRSHEDSKLNIVVC